MPKEDALILEIYREGEILKMSILEYGDLSSTLRHYSQHRVDFSEIGRLCHEIAVNLSKASVSNPLPFKSLEKAAHALWGHLLTRPIKEKLQEKKDASLLLEIDEGLIFIPWELLFDGSNFLSLNFNIGRIVKTKSGFSSPSYRSLGHVFKMLILANPTNDLRGAYLEGLNIKNQFDRRRSNIRIDFKSTSIDRLYLKKNLSDYDIAHFAGHCEYIDHDPKASGWVLNDGNFSVQDILRLGSGLSLPALVFSNACHSAQVSPSECALDSDYQKKNYSLASAFLFSGVRHYIGSIRKIEDTASLSFAKEFYHQLTLGKPLGYCLRLSRLKLIKDYSIYSMHWANYLLYGDPVFAMFKPRQVKVRKRRTIPKQLFFRISLASIIVTIAIILYSALPTINPSTYFLFLRSQRLYAKGANQEVLSTGERIISQDKGFLSIYPVLGDTYHRIGDKEKAIKYYFDYMMLAQRKHNDTHLAAAYIAIGWFYHLDGEYGKAKDFYEKAVTLSQKKKDKLNEAVALRKLAVWNIDNNNYDLALELLTKSSEINRERQNIAQHRYNLACDYFDIGLIFSDKNDLAAAEEFYRKSRLLFEKVNLKNELSDYYFNLGELYLFEKEYEKALNLYLQGLKLDEDQGNKRNLSSDYNMIGELYLEMDNFAEAERNFNRAFDIAEELKFKPDIANASRNLGILYKKTGKIKRSKEFLRKAQEIYSLIDPLAYEEVKKEILSLN